MYAIENDCIFDVRFWFINLYIVHLIRYVDRPLTLGGHKFHLRVYVLCVGALKVYVYDRILALLAAHRYAAAPVDVQPVFDCPA